MSNKLKEKWTQGKWKIGCYLQGGASLSSQGHYFIATKDVCSFINLQSEEKDESLANAHLIAAAPDMYRVIKELSAIFDLLSEKIKEEDYDENFVEIKSAIDLQLAKARGEQ